MWVQEWNTRCEENEVRTWASRNGRHDRSDRRPTSPKRSNWGRDSWDRNARSSMRRPRRVTGRICGQVLGWAVCVLAALMSPSGWSPWVCSVRVNLHLISSIPNSSEREMCCWTMGLHGVYHLGKFQRARGRITVPIGKHMFQLDGTYSVMVGLNFYITTRYTSICIDMRVFFRALRRIWHTDQGSTRRLKEAQRSPVFF